MKVKGELLGRWKQRQEREREGVSLVKYMICKYENTTMKYFTMCNLIYDDKNKSKNHILSYILAYKRPISPPQNTICV
jgi:hypothetical protein